MRQFFYMKEFQASQISCKEKILSEDYWDFILPPNRSQEVLGVDSGDMCMQEMDFNFYAAYVNRCYPGIFQRFHIKETVTIRYIIVPIALQRKWLQIQAVDIRRIKIKIHLLHTHISAINAKHFLTSIPVC